MLFSLSKLPAVLCGEVQVVPLSRLCVVWLFVALRAFLVW